MRSRVRLLIVAVIALAAAALAAPSGASAATPQAPWSDPNAKGYIGFCNAANQQVYSGSIDAYPFVAKAVSSTPAPAGYGAKVGRVTLYAFQPIQFVNPGDWSGKQMSGGTVFSNSAAPMTVGLSGDPSLVNFTAAFPLHWNGFAQLRMYYTAPAQQAYTSSYPAAAIQVSGTTWTQVGGGKVNCAAGQAESDEADLKVANVQQHQGGSTATATAGASQSATSGGSVSSSGSGAGADTSLSPAALSKKSSGGSGTGLAIGIAIAVVGIVAGAVLFLRRRRVADYS